MHGISLTKTLSHLLNLKKKNMKNHSPISLSNSSRHMERIKTIHYVIFVIERQEW